MAKSIMTISVDHEVKEALQLRFPRQASTLIEEYLRNLLSANFDVESIQEKKELRLKLQEIQNDINSRKASLQLIQSKLKNIEIEEQQVLNQDIETYENEFFDLPQIQKDKIIAEFEIEKQAGNIPINMFVKRYYAINRAKNTIKKVME